jgi:hypothetical protein
MSPLPFELKQTVCVCSELSVPTLTIDVHAVRRTQRRIIQTTLKKARILKTPAARTDGAVAPDFDAEAQIFSIVDIKRLYCNRDLAGRDGCLKELKSRRTKNRAVLRHENTLRGTRYSVNQVFAF